MLLAGFVGQRLPLPRRRRRALPAAPVAAVAAPAMVAAVAAPAMVAVTATANPPEARARSIVKTIIAITAIVILIGAAPAIIVAAFW